MTTKIEFRSRTNLPKCKGSPTGEKEIQNFRSKIDKETGKIEIVPDGKINIYDKIQAAAEGTTIKEIINRFQQGDLEALNQAAKQYADTTGLPKTLAEAHQRIIDAEAMFMKLPPEIREKFNHSPIEFVAPANEEKVKQVLKEITDKNNLKTPREATEAVKTQEPKKEETK